MRPTYTHAQTNEKGELDKWHQQKQQPSFFSDFSVAELSGRAWALFQSVSHAWTEKGRKRPSANRERARERGRYGFGPSQVKQLT